MVTKVATNRHVRSPLTGLPVAGNIEQVFVTTVAEWQSSLFGAGAPEVDRSFARLERCWLDEDTWVDVAPGWLAGADVVFDDMLRLAPWKQRRVTMYGRLLDEPRLTAWWPLGGPGAAPLPVLESAWSALCDRYDRPFDSLGANLYRDGRDSVAWHSDRIGREAVEPVVAIVTLGSPRSFLLRPRQGGPPRALRPGPGDLLVLGGRCQHDWEHCVPKVAVAGPRLSLMFRHGEPEPGSGERAPPQP
jgi:alkylated DNA repair dioxygenase AlkB